MKAALILPQAAGQRRTRLRAEPQPDYGYGSGRPAGVRRTAESRPPSRRPQSRDGAWPLCKASGLDAPDGGRDEFMVQLTPFPHADTD